MAITSDSFGNMACLWLGNERVRLAITTDRGPRVVFWGWRDGENLLAELPGASMPTPNGTYFFVGGHRLWYAPEALRTTYWPDNDPLAVEVIGDNSASFTAPPDGTGIVKALLVEMSPDRPEVIVTHTLRNDGREPVHLAPWAISMCRTGGVALLPQPQGHADPDEFLPNRHFSFWPYSDVNDPRLLPGNRLVLVKAEPGPNNKLGYRSAHGWLAYWLDGTLFSKRFDPTPAGDYPDGGCNAEVFFAANVIELETLGPLVRLEPGGHVAHTEIWALHKAPTSVESEAQAEGLANKAGLSL